MPPTCKNPRYNYTKNKKVRLTWCGNKVVETKTTQHIQLEKQFKRKLRKGKRGGFYFVKNGKRFYVQ